MQPPASAQSGKATALVVTTRRLIALVSLVLPAALFAAFGYSDNGAAYVVDTGAGLVFQVNKSDGTVSSIVYNGIEYNGPSGKGSHLSSGLGNATVTPETDGSTYVKLTLQTGTDGTADPDMTQYLVVRNGENTIYMATFPGQEPNVGELRWITRLDHSKLLNGPEPSNLLDTTGNIESTDVFGKADGTTRSKYYGDHITHGKERAMDLTYDGATGDNVGIWMIFGNRESSSGGPFFRDIQNQGGSDQEIYNYMNSGHNQTEPYRLNVLHGPYALVFNTGAAPTYPIDFSWMGNLNLMGWVPASGRGAVSGVATGIPTGFQGVVGFANANAQYWAVINPPDGSYTCTGMKPGDYIVTLYKGELEVATRTVTVAAGSTAPLNIASTEAAPSVIFRIGEWDGSPAGLLNADHIPQMHPSDVRNGSWGPITYTVGVDDPSTFPSIQTRLANDGNGIRFNLAPNQVTDLTLRIGITCSYPKGGGRPVITVNNNATTAAPAASTQPDSRSFTIGTYRGSNVLYTYTIPAAQLVAGTNTIRINAVSGSADSGTWLSAGWVYDSIELDGPIAAPTITYVGGSPLTISGTSESNRTIAVTLDGTTDAGTTVASPSGAWSLTFMGALPAGPHTLTAVASDTNGHSSPSSAPFTFNTAITMPVITQAVGDTGTYGSGATTSDRVFTFQGTAGAGDTVTLTRIGVGAIGTTLADGSGNWSFDYSSVSLPDGQSSFHATSSNIAGNSASSSVFTLNLQGAPRVAIVRSNPAAQVITAGFGSVVFRVTFNAPVSGVTNSSFAVATTNTATGSVGTVSGGSGTVFDVTVGNLAGVGELHLNLTSNNGVVDGNNHPENPYTAGEFYQLVQPSTGNGTWTQPVSDGRWSDPRNWQNAVIADGAGSSANFSALDLTGANTVHLDSARTLNSVVFGDTDTSSAASWTIDGNGSGNTLTLAGTNPALTVNALGAGATATIATPLAGTSGLTKTGAGTLVLAASNTISGPLNVTTGTVIMAPGASQTVTTATMASPNGTLNINGGTLSASGATTANGGGGTLVINAGTGNFAAVATSNSSNGLIRVNGGTFNAASVNIPRSSDATASFAFGFVVAGGAANVSGTVGLGTNNSWGSMSVEGGSLMVGGPITLGNQATAGRGGQMRVIGNATFTSTDTTSGIILSRKSGTNANNVATATFTGGVSTIEKFTLGFDNTVNAGSATLTLNGGTVYLGSGGIVQNGVSPFVVTVSLSSGTFGAKANWATSVPITLPSGGNIALKAADAGNNPFNITFTGVVGGAGGFTKIGGGTLVLDGGVTHTYAGATAINGGALRVTSTLAASANAIAINATGALTGNGIIGRGMALNSGGLLAPDGPTPVATLTGTSLTWNGGGTIAADLGASGISDVLALSGAFNQGAAGSYTFAFTPGAGFAAGNTYTLVTFGSTTFTDASAFSATGLPNGTGALFQLKDTSLQVRIQHQANLTSANTASGMFGAPFSYTATADDVPATFSATNIPPGLALDAVSGTLTGTPGAAGTFVVPITVTNTAGSTTSTVTITIAPAPASVSLGGLNATYDGNAHTAIITTNPGGLPVAVTYNNAAAPLPLNAGSYLIAATVTDPNYIGGTSGTLIIAKATPTISVTPYTVTYDGSAHRATGTATGARGESLGGLDLSATSHTNAGTYGDAWVITDGTGNYVNLSGSITDVINKANATITLSGLTQPYDGTPKAVLETTDPTGLTVTITYNGGATAPTLPGAYSILATVDDDNYTATLTGTERIGTTALVRHAPVMNGDLDGSVQVLLAESITLNGHAGITGDLLVPGTPTVRLNGNPTFAGIHDGGGATSPTDFVVTLNGSALLRHLVQRVDPVAMPTAPAPAIGSGTRDVVLNNATDPAGDFATIRDLTLNGGAGMVTLPSGAYRNVTANGNTVLVLGSANSTTAAEYDLQTLSLNGNAHLVILGPVTVVLNNATTVSATIGASDHPEWLNVSVAAGGVTLNGSAIVYGSVVAPNGSVIVNGNGAVHGSVTADRLTINGNGAIVQP